MAACSWTSRSPPTWSPPTCPPTRTRASCRRPRCAQVSERYVEDLRVATPSVDREVRYLSGGNQQKVLLAKWLARQPRILIVDEPTRGVDVGSKADIYRILRDLAASGLALLVVSSDLPEVLALAHRIVVMSEGRVAGELDAASATEIAILELAAPRARDRARRRHEQRGRARGASTPAPKRRAAPRGDARWSDRHRPAAAARRAHRWRCSS